ncbi:hypothetical protein AAMO2058_000067800 [Amorphochlora amoebiformis]|uniref:Oxygen-evolving enhancer protein 3 n=1 Tax=Amorphochlora amoebiformis TaxID=1561963 RepID=A0A7S0H8F8_9EUKA|mmetsp:Transcript_5757/g.8848  ORF Transcript_5757/g.8848 Transcript_5757/m.8848 type:complete len:239 (+) Transcript_5757:256-972(+)
MQYRAIEEGKALAPRVTKKSSFVAVAVIAVVCCVAGAMMFGGSSQLQNAVRSNVNCRNVRATAGVDRRAMMGGLFGIAAAGANKAFAAGPGFTNPDFIDDRKAKTKGFDIIYEARDLSLDQNVRDGMTQARSSLDATKARVKDAEVKLNEAGAFVDKKYWTEGRNVLRRLVGTLRFDLAALASSKTGASKKEAMKANKEFFASLESFDLAMSKKNVDAGKKAFAKTISAYKNAVSLTA